MGRMGGVLLASANALPFTTVPPMAWVSGSSPAVIICEENLKLRHWSFRKKNENWNKQLKAIAMVRLQSCVCPE